MSDEAALDTTTTTEEPEEDPRERDVFSLAPVYASPAWRLGPPPCPRPYDTAFEPS